MNLLLAVVVPVVVTAGLLQPSGDTTKQLRELFQKMDALAVKDLEQTLEIIKQFEDVAKQARAEGKLDEAKKYEQVIKAHRELEATLRRVIAAKNVKPTEKELRELEERLRKESRKPR